MDTERFGLNQGRERPKYQPKDIHCPHCGAGLRVKDEHSELVVCDYCGSHLDVTQEEKQVIAGPAGKKWDFPLEIGDSFRFKGSRYEIIGRMVFMEDGDFNEISRQYLIYNPRQGSLYLDEYQGSWSVSETSHVMPRADAFSQKRGDILKTHDQRQWVCEGTGVYELVYVDGALPWIAKTGDQIAYAEFSEKGATGLQYEVQRIENEIEYGMGRALSTDMVRHATGKPDLPGAVGKKAATDAAGMRKLYLQVLVVAVLAFAVNAALALYCLSRGNRVLSQSFSAAQLSRETYTDFFPVAKDGDIIKVTARSGLDNAWMAMDLAVVRRDESVIHTFEDDISYYHGVEGGESWSEGSHSDSTYIKIPEAGEYQLLLHAVSATGETPSATRAVHDAQIEITAGAMAPGFAFFGCIVTAVILALTFFSYRNWKKGEDED